MPRDNPLPHRARPFAVPLNRRKHHTMSDADGGGGGGEGTSSESRARPNILVTGTPGVGKSSTASLIAERLGMKHIEVGELIKSHKFHGDKDSRFDSLVLGDDDEDRLLDLMEEMLATKRPADSDDGDDSDEREGGFVVDYHGCDLFPERWFDLVLVLRARTDVLYDRLTKRGYSEAKRSENVECEIMQVVLEEASGSYAAEAVHEVRSDTVAEMESNVDRVEKWAEQWVRDNS